MAGQGIALPLRINLENENGVLSVSKTVNGVCVELNHDMQVCCYDDSKSCTVAASRWFTGKLDGLLGRADSNVKETKPENWFLDATCKNTNAKTKLPTEDAVKACYQMFGSHRNAFFRDAINVSLNYAFDLNEILKLFKIPIPCLHISDRF